MVRRTSKPAVFGLTVCRLPSGGLAHQAGDHRRALPARRRHRRLWPAAVRRAMTKNTGKQFVIDNKGGAGGTLGAGIAAKAAPDGYTSSWARCTTPSRPACTPSWTTTSRPTSCPWAWSPACRRSSWSTRKRVQATDAAAVAGHVRKNPGKLNYGSAGNGTSHHLAGELFKLQTKTFITHIPYRGAGPALQDLIAGQVDMMFDGLGSSAAHIKPAAACPGQAQGVPSRCGPARQAVAPGLGPQGHARRRPDPDSARPPPTNSRRQRRAHYQVATWYWRPVGPQGHATTSGAACRHARLRRAHRRQHRRRLHGRRRGDRQLLRYAHGRRLSPLWRPHRAPGFPNGAARGAAGGARCRRG
jgi:hypothetical protein